MLLNIGQLDFNEGKTCVLKNQTFKNTHTKYKMMQNITKHKQKKIQNMKHNTMQKKDLKKNHINNNDLQKYDKLQNTNPTP